MSVKKIFVMLITVVCCVIVGAFVINILLPNVTATLVNAVEDQIYRATGMEFDFNLDGTMGSASNGEYKGERTGTEAEIVAEDAVVGFESK